MAFADPDKFDHDGNGRAGGSLRRGKTMAKKTDPALDEAAVEGEAPEHNLDPNDPAVTGIPRDERHDSINPHTGTLTDEAVALRAERAAEAE